MWVSSLTVESLSAWLVMDVAPRPAGSHLPSFPALSLVQPRLALCIIHSHGLITWNFVSKGNICHEVKGCFETFPCRRISDCEKEGRKISMDSRVKVCLQVPPHGSPSWDNRLTTQKTRMELKVFGLMGENRLYSRVNAYTNL